MLFSIFCVHWDPILICRCRISLLNLPAFWLFRLFCESLSWHSIVFESDSAFFSLLTPRKAQHSGPLQRFSLSPNIDPLICPIACLRLYIFSTDLLRSPVNEGHLFLCLIRPYRPASGNTLARWIKSFLAKSGVDTHIFSAHSTRGAAASDALRSGAPIDAVLRAGHWSRRSTFDRFYNRSSAAPDL